LTRNESKMIYQFFSKIDLFSHKSSYLLPPPIKVLVCL
jgi:hypothetical protein